MDTKNDTGIGAIARRHGFSDAAGHAMAAAIKAGGGGQAQFDHPELGGMGQWSRGGMTMIGQMNDGGLKARVAALAQDLAQDLAKAMEGEEDGGGDGDGADVADGWPANLGRASSTGSQNDMSYAVFPDTRRLAVREGGRVSVYDTGDHHIGGVSQSQGDRRSLSFSSQNGPVSLDDLTPVPAGDDKAP